MKRWIAAAMLAAGAAQAQAPMTEGEVRKVEGDKLNGPSAKFFTPELAGELRSVMGAEAGDLLLLPLKPGGVEHKHYNRYEDKPAKWIAFISGALFEWGASEMVQLENHPDFKSKNNARSPR